MSQFFLFAYDDKSACGGAWDSQGVYDSLEAAKEAALTRVLDAVATHKGPAIDRCTPLQYWDIATVSGTELKVVLEGYPQFYVTGPDMNWQEPKK